MEEKLLFSQKSDLIQNLGDTLSDELYVNRVRKSTFNTLVVKLEYFRSFEYLFSVSDLAPVPESLYLTRELRSLGICLDNCGSFVKEILFVT